MAARSSASLDDGEVIGGAPGSVGDNYGTAFSGATSVENTYVVEGINTTGNGFSAIPQRDESPIDGKIHGVATDKRSGDTLAGVTVIASDSAGHEHTVITDDNGAYTVSALPAGTYTVTFYYADSTNVQKAVHVAAGSTAQVSPRLDQSNAKGEMIAIDDKVPIIDQGSTKSGVTISNDYMRNIPVGRTFESVVGESAGAQHDTMGADAKIKAMAQKLAGSPKDVVIETSAGDVGRAAAVRDKLVDAGVPAKRIHVVPRDGANGLHLLAVAPGQVAQAAAPAAPKGPQSDEPVGETHFIAERPMDVRAGTSAMVAMVHAETAGGVVYLYDPISDRGDARFAFKAIKLDNPTDDTLEPGPMTVYGDGRFVGEGLTEAVPPRAAVVVPFAADRQVMVTQTGSEQQRISRLETVQRGVLTAEVQRHRTTHFLVQSRLDQPAKIFLRHRLESGWTLKDAPPKQLQVGNSSLFEVDVPAKGSLDVAITESAPMERSLELSSDSALDMMKVYLDEPDATPALKSQLEALLATHRGAADLVDKIATMREQLGEYKSRSGELHAQLVTLKAVRTSGDLMDGLRAKLLETSNKVQKLTISIVDAEEQLMLMRVKYGNELADLHLTDVTGLAKQ